MRTHRSHRAGVPRRPPCVTQESRHGAEKSHRRAEIQFLNSRVQDMGRARSGRILINIDVFENAKELARG